MTYDRHDPPLLVSHVHSLRPSEIFLVTRAHRVLAAVVVLSAVLAFASPTSAVELAGASAVLLVVLAVLASYDPRLRRRQVTVWADGRMRFASDADWFDARLPAPVRRARWGWAIGPGVHVRAAFRDDEHRAAFVAAAQALIRPADA